MDRRYFGVLLAIMRTATGQCTWQSAFVSSTWHDSTRGDIIFTTTTMTGWSVNIRSQTFNTWECIDSSNSSYIIMKATNQLTYSSLSFYVYACLQLTKITDVSYWYYLLNQQENNGGYERLRFSTTDTLATASDVCDRTASVPTQEFHVLVKSGMESEAPIKCPPQFLYSADYVYNGTCTYACADSVDMWDVCTNSTEMTFNYTTCSQEIAFSSTGKLWCVASIGQCVSLYNQDSTITASTRRFSCLCSDGVYVAIVPDNCTATQTPGIIPTGSDGTSVIGHLVTIGTKYEDCGFSLPEDCGGVNGSSMGVNGTSDGMNCTRGCEDGTTGGLNSTCDGVNSGIVNMNSTIDAVNDTSNNGNGESVGLNGTSDGENSFTEGVHDVNISREDVNCTTASINDKNGGENCISSGGNDTSDGVNSFVGGLVAGIVISVVIIMICCVPSKSRLIKEPIIL